MAIPMVKVPKFTTTLPVSGEVVEFRPFLVKEEKLLLLASESNENNMAVSAISDIVENCTFGKIKSTEYAMADVQWMFMKIRSKSIGEEVNLYLICGQCDHKILKTMSIDDFEVRFNENKDRVINIDSTIRVELKYPTIHHYDRLFDTTEEDAVYDVVADCISKIYSDEEVFVNDGNSHQELREFIDNLTAEQFESFEEFFETMPVLFKEVNFKCVKCEVENSLVVNTVQHFFG